MRTNRRHVRPFGTPARAADEEAATTTRPTSSPADWRSGIDGVRRCRSRFRASRLSGRARTGASGARPQAGSAGSAGAL